MITFKLNEDSSMVQNHFGAHWGWRGLSTMLSRQLMGKASILFSTFILIIQWQPIILQSLSQQKTGSYHSFEICPCLFSRDRILVHNISRKPSHLLEAKVWDQNPVRRVNELWADSPAVTEEAERTDSGIATRSPAQSEVGAVNPRHTPSMKSVELSSRHPHF